MPSWHNKKSLAAPLIVIITEFKTCLGVSIDIENKIQLKKKKNVPQFFHSQHTGMGVQAARKGIEGLPILAVKLSLLHCTETYFSHRRTESTGTELSGNGSEHLANSFVVI